MDHETKKYLDEQFSRVDGRFSDIESRMATKDDLVALRIEMATKDDLQVLRAEISEVTESVSKLATHIDERFDEITPAIERVDNHDKRIRSLEDRVADLAKA